MSKKDFNINREQIKSYVDREDKYKKKDIVKMLQECNKEDIEHILNEWSLELLVQHYISIKRHYIGGQLMCPRHDKYFRDWNTYAPHMIEELFLRNDCLLIDDFSV
jgi:hypothetical protein